MIEQLRTPTIPVTGNTAKDLAELKRFIHNTITSLNVILLDIDRRLNAIEKGEKNG